MNITLTPPCRGTHYLAERISFSDQYNTIILLSGRRCHHWVKNGLTRPPLILKSVLLWSFSFSPLFDLNTTHVTVVLYAFSDSSLHRRSSWKMAVHRDSCHLLQTIPPAEHCCGNLHGQQKWEDTRLLIEMFWNSGCMLNNLTVLCDSPQWRSCLTSQMQPQSRRWSTVFREWGWERILVCHRQGDKQLLRMSQQDSGGTATNNIANTHTHTHTHTNTQYELCYIHCNLEYLQLLLKNNISYLFNIVVHFLKIIHLCK